MKMYKKIFLFLPNNSSLFLFKNENFKNNDLRWCWHRKELELSISAYMIRCSWTADRRLVYHVSPVPKMSPKCWETMAWLDSWRRLGPRNRSLNCIRESLLRKFSLLRNFLRVQFVIIPRESFGGSSSSYSKVWEPGEKWAPSESSPPSPKQCETIFPL